MCQMSPMVSSQAMINCKEVERAGIEMEVALFLRAGGTIKQCNSKGDVIVDTPPPDLSKGRRKRDFGRNGNDLPIHLVPPPKAMKDRQSPHGQNIRKTGEFYWVNIGSLEMGRGEKWSHEYAIKKRDHYRQIHNMGPAEY